MKNFQSSKVASGTARRAESHRQTAMRLQGENRWDKACAEFEHATRLVPNDALVWLQLARARNSLGDVKAAAEAAHRAFKLEPANPIACRLAADCELRLQRPANAVTILEALPADVPRDHDFYCELGHALYLVRRPREAIEAFLKALKLKVGAAVVYYRLGMCFHDLAMPRDAAVCFRAAVALDPGEARTLALGVLVFESRQACEWEHEAEDTRTFLEAVDHADAQTAARLTPFTLIAVDSTPAQQRLMGQRRVEATAKGIAPLPVAGPRRPGRIRVGYLSADFCHHATVTLILEMLERRDTERFEVFLYSHSPHDNTDVSHRIRGACEHFVDVNEMRHQDIAQRMRDDGIDIAIDLKGYTRDTRMEVFAFRPAPVQAAWLGYPASTGADFIDYIIGDRIVTPIEHAADFSERIAQLPVCYQPNDRGRALPPSPSRTELGLPEGAVVLCCFNQSYKLSPAMLDHWACILAQAPRAVLWLLIWNPHAQQNLLREFERRGIGAERIFFAPKIGLADHIARLRAADLFLDTWPCNAHTTASEALWAGVPVLTVPGPTFASRVGASLVTACGLPDLVCQDAEHYAGLAAALANDPATLAGIRAHLEAHRMDLPLFDSERQARDFEALLLRMHERHLAGLPPDHLLAS
jgi:predicted O-linked N-acetylglucosamine transferase (SPINDLY family)